MCRTLQEYLNCSGAAKVVGNGGALAFRTSLFLKTTSAFYGTLEEKLKACARTPEVAVRLLRRKEGKGKRLLEREGEIYILR